MTSDQHSVRFLPCGDSAFSMELGQTIDRAVNARIIALHKRLAEQPLHGVIEAVPSFRALLVIYDPDRAHPEALQRELLALLEQAEALNEPGRRWIIPVCYGGAHGPDLPDVARTSGLSESEVIRRHAGQPYFVYMMGFLPGFPYMGDVAEVLRLPRRTVPRTDVPRGSVAIAQEMTAIYPLESPGGWHVLGRTPWELFDAHADRPVLLAPGDEVTFEPISPDEFAMLEREAGRGERGA